MQIIFNLGRRGEQVRIAIDFMDYYVPVYLTVEDARQLARSPAVSNGTRLIAVHERANEELI